MSPRPCVGRLGLPESHWEVEGGRFDVLHTHPLRKGYKGAAAVSHALEKTGNQRPLKEGYTALKNLT